MSTPHSATGQAGWPARLVAAALLGLLPLLLAAQERPARVVLVDMQRLLDSAPQMQQARARLTSEFAERDAALREQRDRLAQMEQRLRSGTPPLATADAAALGREIDTLRRSIERTQNRLRDDLAARNREERDRVWDQLNDAVAQYARANDIDLVLPSPVLYASARVDITDRVLDLLRQQASEVPP